MPSLAVVDSNFGSSWPHEDNAGAPSEQYQSSGNNSSSPVHHALALYASGHFSFPISSRFIPSAYNTKHNYKLTLETLPG